MSYQKAFKKFLVDLNSKFPDVVPSAKLDEKDIEIFQKLFISDTMEVLKKDPSIFNEPKLVFGIDLSEIFKQNPELVWKYMQPCLFSSFLHGDIKSKITQMLPELLGAFKEQLGGQNEIDEILGDETKQSKIGEFIDYLKNSKFASLITSVFESIDLSDLDTSNIEEVLHNPTLIQQHPIVLRIQGQIQSIMTNKVKNGELSKEAIIQEFETMKGKLQEFFGESLNEALGTQRSDVAPEVLLSNSPEARRARMIARLQRKLKDRKK